MLLTLIDVSASTSFLMSSRDKTSESYFSGSLIIATQWLPVAEYAKSPSSSKVKPKFTTCRRFPMLVSSPVNLTLIFFSTMKSADGDDLSTYRIKKQHIIDCSSKKSILFQIRLLKVQFVICRYEFLKYV